MSRIAIVDDEPRMGRILGMVLQRAGHEVDTYESGVDFLDAEADPDVLLTDLRMPGMDGMELLRRVRGRGVPVVMITAHGSVENAVEAMKQGAFDYLSKPIDNATCRDVVARALVAREASRRRAALRTEGGVEVIAESPVFRQVLEEARSAAQTRFPVLVEGASGAGKEIVARLVHELGPRRDGPFVALNVMAVAQSMMEAELFGHEKGAFTGASESRPGLFERAHGGTLLLDEIEDMPAELQGKLLRVLEEREVVRVGGSQRRPFDVRVVSCTNRSLEEARDAGRFREDLYYRLVVLRIRVPGLDERVEDIVPLAEHFLAGLVEEYGQAASMSPSSRVRLAATAFPGNVRELRSAVIRAYVRSGGGVLEPSDFELPAEASAPAFTLAEVVDAAARARIEQVLKETGGRRAEAAARLGIDRTTLYRHITRLGVSE